MKKNKSFTISGIIFGLGLGVAISKVIFNNIALNQWQDLIFSSDYNNVATQANAASQHINNILVLLIILTLVTGIAGGFIGNFLGKKIDKQDN